MHLIRFLGRRYGHSPLVKNTYWMFLGYGFRLVIQAVYFILIARSLGARGYGAFVGICALVGILSPYSGLGGGNLLIKNVARAPHSFGRYWGNALLLILLTGSVLLIPVLGISLALFSPAIPLSMIFAVAVADLFFSRILDAGGQAFQAFDRLGGTAFLQVLPSLFRLAAIVCLDLLVDAPTPLQWAWLYLLCTAAGAAVGVAMVNRMLGRAVFTLSAMKGEMTEGFYFSVSLSAQSFYNDIDKTMLARLSGLGAAGIYSAAYRVVDVSFSPVRSLLHAAYARFFRHGEDGMKGSLGFARTLFPAAGGYALLCGALLVASSPILPRFLGAEYRDASEALRWLAPLPLLKSIHYFAADALTGAGFQGVRSGIQVFVAVFNVGVNLALIPAYSWRGAAWASIASDGLLAAMLGLALLFMHFRESFSVRPFRFPSSRG